jgi:hypothetical protein
MNNKCVAFISNKRYLLKTLNTLTQLRKIGKYTGDVIIIRGTDWDENTDKSFIEYKKFEIYPIYVKEFSEIDTSNIKNIFNKCPYESPFNCRVDKLFQLHKFYLFHEYMKKWDVVLFIDAGFKVHREIEDVWTLDWKNKLIANEESFKNPTWTLSLQFCIDKENPFTKGLNQDFNLNCKYFQSGFLMYDTNIIQKDTFSTLIYLMNKYPTFKTNDQAIMNLLFNLTLKNWKALHTLNQNIYEYWVDKNMNQIFSKGN